MAQIPLIKTGTQGSDLFQTRLKSILDPIISIPLLSGSQITGVSISSGSAAVINHLLGRKQQGWILTDIDAPAKIARIAALNDKTLTLSSDATVTVSVWVY